MKKIIGMGRAFLMLSLAKAIRTPYLNLAEKKHKKSRTSASFKFIKGFFGVNLTVNTQ